MISIILLDIQSFSDADVELALSRLSDGELKILEKLMENEVETSKIEKREILENYLDKRCNSRHDCKERKDSDENEYYDDDENYKQVMRYEQLPGSFMRSPLTFSKNSKILETSPHKTRRIFKRHSRIAPLSRDQILEARIDFLKDNYKRQSESKIKILYLTKIHRNTS